MVKMKRRVFNVLLASVLTVTSVVLGGCGSSATTSSSGSSEESATKAVASTSEINGTESSSDKVKIVMYGSPDPQISAAQTIALVNGYYEEEGLDVDLQYIDNSAELGPMLGSGDIDIAFANSYAAITWAAADIGMNVVAVNCDMSGTQAAAIRKDIEIESPKDLEGLKVGIVTNTEIEIAIRRMCDEAGVDFDKLQLVPLNGGSEILSALDAGNIDILAAWEPWVTNAEALGHKFLMSASKSEIPGLEGDKDWVHVYSVMLVNDKFKEENPEVCGKIMRACNKATDYINDNREEAVSLLSEAFNIDEAALTKIMSRNVYSYGASDEYMETTQWLEGYLLDSGIIEKDVKLEDFTDFSILKDAVPEAYKITE